MGKDSQDRNPTGLQGWFDRLLHKGHALAGNGIQYHTNKQIAKTLLGRKRIVQDLQIIVVLDDDQRPCTKHVGHLRRWQADQIPLAQIGTPLQDDHIPPLGHTPIRRTEVSGKIRLGFAAQDRFDFARSDSNWDHIIQGIRKLERALEELSILIDEISRQPRSGAHWLHIADTETITLKSLGNPHAECALARKGLRRCHVKSSHHHLRLSKR